MVCWQRVYDTDDLERADSMFHAFEFETLVEKMERFMKMRKSRGAFCV